MARARRRQPAVLDGVVGQAGHLPRAAGHPRAAAAGRAVLRHGPGRWPARPLSSPAHATGSRRPPPRFRHCRREPGGGYGDRMVRARSWRWRRTGGCTPYGAPGEPLTSARRGCGLPAPGLPVETGCCLVQVLGCGPRSGLIAPSLVRRSARAAGPRKGADRVRDRLLRVALEAITIYQHEIGPPSLRAAASPRGARATPRPRWRSWACAAGAGSRPGACCAATPGPWEGTTPSRCPPPRAA